MGRLAEALECDVALLPISYLGLPLGAKFSLVSIWNPVIKRMSKKLSTWKGKHLSEGGKLVMLKSVWLLFQIISYLYFRPPRV